MKNFLAILIPGALALIAGCADAPESWTFDYPGDTFSDEALLDLRHLNESFAGEHGFIRLSDDGRSFVRGDGKEIRFWPVNGGEATSFMSDDDLAWHARFLAKQGVNMNRWHGSINPGGKGTDIFEVDTSEIKLIWRFVAAMKKEGIYTTISPFWAHNGHMGDWVPAEWEIEGYAGRDHLWEVMYYNERLKEAYKTWVRYLYTTTNPYTGIPLKDDPSVALIQIKNEDGVFWWTMQMVKPELKALVSNKFAAWLKQKYGSISGTMEAWEYEVLEGDDLAAGQFAMYSIWEMTREHEGPKAIRMADQTEFYAWIQYEFYREIYGFYRDELECNQLINPNNWKTADPARLNDLERWTYSSCEVPALNRYYAPGHVGPNNGWRIDPGDSYTGISALFRPDKIPVAVKQVNAAPMLITESGWNLPHLYQSEGPALVAAYQSLTGVDAFYWFSINARDYMEFPYFDFTRDSAGMYAMNRWTYATPGGIAQFPAYALMFRKGYIQQGETMIREVRSMEQLWNREIALISEDVSFDPNRDQLEGIRTVASSGGITPLAFLTGPVEAKYGGDPAETYIDNRLGNLVDQELGLVRSVTGELELNYKKGKFTFDAPAAAGMSGFKDEHGKTVLKDVSIETENDYITVGVISMDDLPLTQSRKILIQTGTTYRPTGWMEEKTMVEMEDDTIAGFRILNTGRMPWQASPTRVKLSIGNPGISRARQLDPAGYPISELKVRKVKDQIEITLPHDALYVVLSDQ